MTRCSELASRTAGALLASDRRTPPARHPLTRWLLLPARSHLSLSSNIFSCTRESHRSQPCRFSPSSDYAERGFSPHHRSDAPRSPWAQGPDSPRLPGLFFLDDWPWALSVLAPGPALSHAAPSSRCSPVAAALLAGVDQDDGCTCRIRVATGLAPPLVPTPPTQLVLFLPGSAGRRTVPPLLGSPVTLPPLPPRHRSHVWSARAERVARRGHALHEGSAERAEPRRQPPPAGRLGSPEPGLAPRRGRPVPLQ